MEGEKEGQKKGWGLREREGKENGKARTNQ